MDAYEAARIVFSRIQRVEPDNISKIMGSLLSLENGDQEMIRLAFGPDALLYSFIAKAKSDFASIYDSRLPLSLLNTDISPPFHSPPSPHGVLWGPQQLERPITLQPEHTNYLNCRPNSSLIFEKAVQMAYVPPNYYHEQAVLIDSNNPQNGMMRSGTEFLCTGYMNHDSKVDLDKHNSGIANAEMKAPSLICDMNVWEGITAPAWKPCVYFGLGYCKHGSNCRFLHGHTRHNNNNNCSSLSSSSTESRNPDEYFQNGLLEIELEELLRVKRAPVSIAALPQLYYERYGKTLQAEGYLTESQRHGKAGYSLTKLLARLKDTVTLINRPHGQHAVVLAEDAPKFMAYTEGLDYLGRTSSSSRQIYLTFPAESTFTEEDVSNYFRTYGPVHDVRIPYQQKRMFGFVTFTYPETVKIILGKGNPHYVCGSRVLVKPYREKGKVRDRKHNDRVKQPKYVSANNKDTDDFDPMNYGIRIFEDSEINTGRMEEQEQAIELATSRFAELHLAAAEAQTMQHPAGSQASIVAASTEALLSHTLQNNGANGPVHSDEESTESGDLDTFPSNDHFGYLLDVLEKNGDEPTHESNEDQGSYGHILPDSPFANIDGSNMIGTLHNSEERKRLTGERLVTIPKTSDAYLELDPKKLECNHSLCFKCMPKMGETSYLDYRNCEQQKGNQLKLRGNSALQDFLGKTFIPASTVW